MDKRYDLTRNCWFDCVSWDGKSVEVSLNYIERQQDPWYSDAETEVYLTRDEAMEIIKFLREAFEIGGDEA